MTGFANGQRLRHEIYIDAGKRDLNAAIFESSLRQEEQFETAYGWPLHWEELPNARASKIADYLDDADVTFEDRHDEFVDWLFDSGTRMRLAIAAVDVSVQRMPRSRDVSGPTAEAGSELRVLISAGASSGILV